MGESKLAWVYLRVSTDRQNVENQRIQIREFAQRHDFVIPDSEWFIDDGVHGTIPALERPMFLKLHDRLVELKSDDATKLPKNIIMYEVSRIGRTFWETLEAIKFLEDLAPILSTSPKESFIQQEDKSMRNFLLAILAWVAERERAVLVQRVTEGVERAYQEGKHRGKVPSGYNSWDHETECPVKDHGFGSDDKNLRLCPLRGKLYINTRGKVVYNMLMMNPKLKAPAVAFKLDMEYKAAYDLLDSVRKFGWLEASQPTVEDQKSK